MNKYKIILAIFFIFLFPISLIDEDVNNDIDYKRIFQNTPKHSYDNMITTIVTSAEQLEQQKNEKRQELKRLMHEKEIRKEQLRIKRQQKDSSIKENIEWLNFHATYYGNDCIGCSGITATGINVQKTIYFKGLRIVAVDPTIIPLGTIVEIKTPNERFKAIAADKGGAIKGYRLDILVESERVSAQYGRHDVQLRIIK
ncbi:3D domain-containing protein [Lysinibacillus sp. CNPSo 3705]|uniref:3D domain-containing protein n=1 Tax=Lysinibacillus sp. CNPSo 3705 TaxID=3028148 RepID=UPI0023643570|nr:3D domain-containing protein [Lysinibacillus sp. CNPSo 3705]MDD1503179.1 3D domain-containing protein [Lysinibacillus sp. CNPSo 3705]